MNFLRLLFIGFMVWLVVAMVRNYLRRVSLTRKPSTQPLPISNMVRCEVCGLHVLETEALSKNARYYCSRQHLESTGA